MSEIRFSLKTDSYREASKKAALAVASIDSIFQGKGMVGTEELDNLKHELGKVVELQRYFRQPRVVRQIHKWLNKHGYDYEFGEVLCSIDEAYNLNNLLDFNEERLNEILNSEDKIQIEHDVIVERIIGFFRHCLNIDSKNVKSRTQFENR